MAEAQADGPPEGTFECAICWQDVPGEPAVLPCCGRPPVGSSTIYCARCLEIICETGPCGVGRCPTCQGFMQMAPSGGGLTIAAGVDECGVCHQASQRAKRVGRAWCAEGQDPLPALPQRERVRESLEVRGAGLHSNLRPPGCHGANGSLAG